MIWWAIRLGKPPCGNLSTRRATGKSRKYCCSTRSHRPTFRGRAAALRVASRPGAESHRRRAWAARGNDRSLAATGGLFPHVSPESLGPSLAPGLLGRSVAAPALPLGSPSPVPLAGHAGGNLWSVVFASGALHGEKSLGTAEGGCATPGVVKRPRVTSRRKSGPRAPIRADRRHRRLRGGPRPR